MRVFTVTLLLVALTTAQDAAQRRDTENKDQVENSSPEESTRDKRGFIITPLSALPAAIIAQLEPYLRAIVPPPILNQVAALLPSAALEVAPQELPALLSATAPLILNRAVAAQASDLAAFDPRFVISQPSGLGISDPRLAGRFFVSPVATNLPAAPPVVPTPAVLARLAAASALRNGFLLSPSVAQGASVVGGRLIVSPALSGVPQSSPLIPTPSVLATARLALPANQLPASLYANSRFTAPFIVSGNPGVALPSPAARFAPNYPVPLALSAHPASVPQQLVFQNQQNLLAARYASLTV